MNLARIPMQYGTVLVLVALAPVVIFLLDRNEPAVALSIVSVLLIAASYWLMFSPAEGSSEGVAGHAGGE